MKKDIHPQYNNTAPARCACGNTFTIGSTLSKIDVEVCSNCHPFFTGEERVIDTAGRVEKFKARRERGAQEKSSLKKSSKKENKEEKQ